MRDDPLNIANQVLDDRYRVQEYLGGGGFGYVYLAYDHSLHDEVALKFPKDSSFNASIINEAKTLHRLDKLSTSGHIVPFYGLVEIKGRQTLTMEYCRGGALVDRIKRAKLGKCEPQQAVSTGRILMQVCLGLEEAHALKCIHRDIKPDNIFLSEKLPGCGKCKVGDFGIAKIVATSHARTVAGTRPYMAPELFQKLGSDSRSDIYSLGITMYQLLAGCLPHDQTLPDFPFMQAVIAGEITPISHFAHVDQRLGAIVMKAIEVKPEKRYPSVGAMREAIQEVLVDFEIDEATSKLREGLDDEKTKTKTIASLVEITERYPLSIRPYLELASLLRQSGKHSDALSVYERARRQMEGNAKLPYLMAQNYAAMKEFFQAIAFMESAIKLTDGGLGKREIEMGKRLLAAWKKQANL